MPRRLHTAGSRRIVALLGLSVGIAAATATLGAQDPRPYRPAFDVSDYALAIDLPDTGATIHGVATLTVNKTLASVDTLRLDLLDLKVNTVTVDGRLARFTQTDTSIVIPLSRKGGRAPVYTVAVDYGGAVTDGLIARVDSAGRWTYFGDNWPNRARHWIPSIDHPSDKATVTWRITAPMNRTVVANGKLVSSHGVLSGDGTERMEWVWRESRRIPVYLMVLGAGPLVELDLGDTDCGLAELQRCVPQSVYTAPEQRDLVPGPFARAGEIVQFFSNLIGPFPYEKLAHVQSSTRFGGMENASEIFYPDGAFRRHTLGEDVIAHETAHQWFGDAVTERDWPHLWLSEGFATYFAALWERAARGDSAFRARLASMRGAAIMDSSSVPVRPVIDTAQQNLLALLDRNSYEKGGFVLHMLKLQIGERAFFDGIRQYYARHRHSTATTDDLRAEMERASKQQLGWFFDQWLTRPGFPEVTATWSYDSTAHEVSVALSQSNRFGTFQFPLTVAVIDSTGAEHRASTRFSPEYSSPQLRIPSPTLPARIVLDPDVDLLASFKVVAPQ